MKQFLCLKNEGFHGYDELLAGKIYGEDYMKMHAWDVLALTRDEYIKEIETFEKDGHTWIRHSGGDCPVPNYWDVEVMISGFTYSDMQADNWAWSCGPGGGNITAYRIMSTGEPEQVVRGDVLHLTQQGFKRHQDHVLGGLAEMLQKDSEKFDMSMDNWKEVSERDYRQPSPQEAAYAAKMAEKDEDESGAGGGKTFPSSALRDMSDKTFANLLGMGQFIGGEE